VALRSNVAELPALARLASHLGAARVLVSNVLAYTEDMRDEILYGYEPRPSFEGASWPVKSGAWILWGTLDLPRMHWGAERRCRFVQDRSLVVGWDGGVSPCYALSHNYSYYALDSKKKQVTRYVLGNVNAQSLAETWTSEDYARFRSEVRSFHFPACPNCDLRDSCDLRERNEGCWGWNPSCADCLWAQDIVRCP
jgi:MoaA/NifB/PqqE/SkfB family radical SAM enzyme